MERTALKVVEYRRKMRKARDDRAFAIHGAQSKVDRDECGKSMLAKNMHNHKKQFHSGGQAS